MTIPIDEALKAEVAEHPDEFGLDPGLSESKRLACLLAAGGEALRAQVMELRRRELYAALAADPGYAQSTRHLSQLAAEHGIL